MANRPSAACRNQVCQNFIVLDDLRLEVAHRCNGGGKALAGCRTSRQCISDVGHINLCTAVLIINGRQNGFAFRRAQRGLHGFDMRRTGFGDLNAVDACHDALAGSAQYGIVEIDNLQTFHRRNRRADELNCLFIVIPILNRMVNGLLLFPFLQCRFIERTGCLFQSDFFKAFVFNDTGNIFRLFSFDERNDIWRIFS